eukprot:gene11285-15139_t
MVETNKLDFTLHIPSYTSYSGWLQKKSNVRKIWANRFFTLQDGSIRYYSKGPPSEQLDNKQSTHGEDLKKEIKLAGCSVIYQTQEDSCRFDFINKGSKKDVMELKANSSEEASQWCKVLIGGIERANILALQHNLRIPEVIEWYYQKQASIMNRTAFLQTEATMDLHYSVTGKVGAKSSTKLFVKMTPDYSGLLFRINIIQKQKLSRVESLNNGRILLFQDITGCFLPSSWSSVNGVFVFSLITREDQLSMEMSSEGVVWLKAVQELVKFQRITVPSSRNIISVSNRPSSSSWSSSMLSNSSQMMRSSEQDDNINSNQFAANSGTFYSCSNEIQLLIESMNSLASQSSRIPEIGKASLSILKVLTDLKSNKEAGVVLGNRMEDFIRALADPTSGILQALDKPGDKSLLNFHLGSMNNKLKEAEKFLTSQCFVGWLGCAVNRPSDTMRGRFDQLDTDMVLILNALIKAVNSATNYRANELKLFERKEYNMMVDIKSSIDSLGGAEAIYKDTIKEKALAKLIQSDPSDINEELQKLLFSSKRSSIRYSLSGASSNSSFVSSSTATSSVNTSSTNNIDNYGNNNNYNQPSCWQKYFCCCWIVSRSTAAWTPSPHGTSEHMSPSTLYRKTHNPMRKSEVQMLDEPLYIQSDG